MGDGDCSWVVGGCEDSEKFLEAEAAGYGEGDEVVVEVDV